MQDEKVCPICKNHCSLAKPKCGRGKKYAETIELPSKSNDNEKKSEDIDKLEDHQKSNIDEKILINLRHTEYTIGNICKEIVNRKKILILLNEVGKITQKKLTKKLGVKSEISSEILSKMEDSGLIKRNDSKKDKRTMDIKLTKEGKKEAVIASTQMEGLYSDMFSCLDINEKEKFLSSLEKLNLDWNLRYSKKNIKCN
ncbi:MarR family transcriptional regulator [Clostridium sp. AL.422]|uniref:MarR family winged helix-turn-helix transcriptional regulator n=1 Tax=Clostridium TaxID=1485 RepID=UPI00293DEB79|nr:MULTISPECIES: MarR family transcriptional regulator [unclassified Clostridium]MDV4149914.1 MarR family transcriptional regulator [Clostridium sp. AL.422]